MVSSFERLQDGQAKLNSAANRAAALEKTPAGPLARFHGRMMLLLYARIQLLEKPVLGAAITGRSA
jgi:hypothetical protein